MKEPPGGPAGAWGARLMVARHARQLDLAFYTALVDEILLPMATGKPPDV